MAVTSLARNSIRGETKYTNFLAGNAVYEPPSDFLISEQILGAQASSIVFSSIPQDYKHLQLRWTAKNTSTGNSASLRINDISSAVYSQHDLYGNGSTIAAVGAADVNSIGLLYGQSSSTTANGFSAGILDLLDYTSTTKFKTIRHFSGVNTSTVGLSNSSGLYRGTDAVTQLTILSSGFFFAAGSRFSLYGSMG